MTNLEANRHKQVLQFISVFTARGQYDQVIEAFTTGCCYWFAFILANRFDNAEIYYDQVENHFTAKIMGRLYDITGECTEQYPNMEPWEKLADACLHSRLVRDCVQFQPPNY